MITDPFPVVARAAVPDIVLDALSPHNVDEVDTIDDEFLALIYSDEELLRDEFDALMAAVWSEPPTRARARADELPPDWPTPGLPSIGARRPLLGDAGRRSLGPRTRAPPDITECSPSPYREREEALDLPD